MKKFLKYAIVILVMCIITGVVFAFTFDALQENKRTESKKEVEVIEKKVITSSNESTSSIRDALNSVFNVTVKSDLWGGEMRNISSGSAVLYKEDSDNYYIITNHHVIRDAGRVNITFEGEEIPVSVIGSDADTDIAVLQLAKDDIKAELNVPQVKDIEHITIGENVYAIGNALGYGQSVTKGIISAIQREFDNSGSKFSYKLIQTDAAINPGNSGGALVDETGKVVGINVLKINARGVEGMGFAIPINAAITISDVIVSQGYLPKAYLGVSTQDLDLDFLEVNKIPKGVLVKRVVEDSAANKAGILENDLIVKVDDVEIHDSLTLGYEIRSRSPGDQVTIEVFRDNSLITLKAKLGKTEK